MSVSIVFSAVGVPIDRE